MMVTYQRILVPIDGSATSERALQEAIRLADDKARLRVVYVLEEIFPLDTEGYAFIDYATLQEAVRLTGERALAQAAEKTQQSGKGAETALLEAKGERIAACRRSCFPSPISPAIPSRNISPTALPRISSRRCRKSQTCS